MYVFVAGIMVQHKAKHCLFFDWKEDIHWVPFYRKSATLMPVFI